MYLPCCGTKRNDTNCQMPLKKPLTVIIYEFEMLRKTRVTNILVLSFIHPIISSGAIDTSSPLLTLQNHRRLQHIHTVPLPHRNTQPLHRSPGLQQYALRLTNHLPPAHIHTPTFNLYKLAKAHPSSSFRKNHSPTLPISIYYLDLSIVQKIVENFLKLVIKRHKVFVPLPVTIRPARNHFQ